LTIGLERLREKGGKTLDTAGRELLERRFFVPPALIEIMVANPLIGVTFSVPEERDASGLGVEMQWLDPEGMLSEAIDVYPGIVAVERGYFPIGMCLQGSGDPYFFRLSDGAVVRIPHEAASETDHALDESAIERVADSIEQLVSVAEWA
jgi:hypothetical protein